MPEGRYIITKQLNINNRVVLRGELLLQQQSSLAASHQQPDGMLMGPIEHPVCSAALP